DSSPHCSTGEAQTVLLQHHQVLHGGLPRAHQDHGQRADPAEGTRRRPALRSRRVGGNQDPAAQRLSRDFFAEDVLDVAPALLGCTLTHAGVTVRLTEVEGYAGTRTPGAHAYTRPL